MGTRVCLGFACLALIGAASGCQRASLPSGGPSGSPAGSPAGNEPGSPALTASAALTETPAAPDRPAGAARTTRGEGCPLTAAGALVGRADSPAARADLARALGNTPIRWIRPGDVVTQDVRPERLNVMIGEDGRIVAVRCG